MRFSMAYIGVCGLPFLLVSTVLFKGANQACLLCVLVAHCVSLLSGMFRLLLVLLLRRPWDAWHAEH